MKLLRFGEAGKERPGLLDENGQIRDLSSVIDDVTGDVLGDEALRKLSALQVSSLPLVEDSQRLGPCLSRVGKVVCIGLNYHDHAKEVGKEAPTEPMIFMKATSSLCGPSDAIEVPRAAEKVDWEVELGLVIGKATKYVSEQDALSHVAGYLCINDVSERDFQSERQGQWTKGKSHDTHGPIGPYLVTKDSAGDVANLHLWCEVDGVMRQNSNTSEMIFGVADIVSYLSQFMSLQAGDIIATGTPAGVGKGIKPDAIYLKPGNRFRCGIAGLGEQEHEVVSA